MDFTSDFVFATIGSEVGSAVLTSPLIPHRASPMPAHRLQPTSNVTAFTREEVVSLGLNMHEWALKRYLEGVWTTLAGPDPQPVFIPQIDPCGRNYRGLLLVPHTWPKMALKA